MRLTNCRLMLILIGMMGKRGKNRLASPISPRVLAYGLDRPLLFIIVGVMVYAIREHTIIILGLA